MKKTTVDPWDFEVVAVKKSWLNAAQGVHAAADQLYWSSINDQFGVGYAASTAMHGVADLIEKLAPKRKVD